MKDVIRFRRGWPVCQLTGNLALDSVCVCLGNHIFKGGWEKNGYLQLQEFFISNLLDFRKSFEAAGFKLILDHLFGAQPFRIKNPSPGIRGCHKFKSKNLIAQESSVLTGISKALDGHG